MCPYDGGLSPFLLDINLLFRKQTGDIGVSYVSSHHTWDTIGSVPPERRENGFQQSFRFYPRFLSPEG
jgi:hypothetical protein